MNEIAYTVVIPNLHSPRIGDVLEVLRQQESVDSQRIEIIVVGRDRYRLVRQAAAAGHPVVGGPIWFDRDAYWTLCDNVAHFHDLLPDIGRGPNRHFMLATANMLVEKAILEKVGMFDESFPRGQDFEISLKIRQAGYDLYFEPEARIIHKPVRDTLGSVLKHSAGWARHSIRIRT